MTSNRITPLRIYVNKLRRDYNSSKCSLQRPCILARIAFNPGPSILPGPSQRDYPAIPSSCRSHLLLFLSSWPVLLLSALRSALGRSTLTGPLSLKGETDPVSSSLLASSLLVLHGPSCSCPLSSARGTYARGRLSLSSVFRRGPESEQGTHVFLAREVERTIEFLGK